MAYLFVLIVITINYRYWNMKINNEIVWNPRVPRRCIIGSVDECVLLGSCVQQKNVRFPRKSAKSVAERPNSRVGRRRCSSFAQDFVANSNYIWHITYAMNNIVRDSFARESYTQYRFLEVPILCVFENPIYIRLPCTYIMYRTRTFDKTWST